MKTVHNELANTEMYLSHPKMPSGVDKSLNAILIKWCGFGNLSFWIMMVYACSDTVGGCVAVKFTLLYFTYLKIKRFRKLIF